MVGLLILLTLIYVFVGLFWAINYGMDWSENKDRYGCEEAAANAARKFLGTPIWPVFAFNSLVKMVNEMKDRV